MNSNTEQTSQLLTS